jgi:ABC-type glycerol-3-phosphate transport system substrate-binding protein
MEEIAAAITVADAMGIDILGAATGSTSASAGHDATFVSWLYTNNGKYVSDDGRTLLFNSPEGVETLEWMINFTNNINGGIENVTDFFQDTAFAQGDHPWYDNKQVFLPINTSFFGHYNVNDPEGYADTSHWGTMLRPRNGDNPDSQHAGTTGYNYSGAWAYTIPAVHPPEMQEAAFKFAEFIGVHEHGGCEFLFAQSRPSPVKACNENEAYYDVNPYWSVVLEGLNTDTPVAITPVQGQLAEILSNSIEEAYFGVKSAEDALNDAHAEMQKLLDEFWAEFDADNM